MSKLLIVLIKKKKKKNMSKFFLPYPSLSSCDHQMPSRSPVYDKGNEFSQVVR